MGNRIPQPTGPRQVRDEVQIAGVQPEVLAPPVGAGHGLAVQHRRRRIERLEHREGRDVDSSYGQPDRMEDDALPDLLATEPADGSISPAMAKLAPAPRKRPKDVQKAKAVARISVRQRPMGRPQCRLRLPMAIRRL